MLKMQQPITHKKIVFLVMLRSLEIGNIKIYLMGFMLRCEYSYVVASTSCEEEANEVLLSSPFVCLVCAMDYNRTS